MLADKESVELILFFIFKDYPALLGDRIYIIPQTLSFLSKQICLIITLPFMAFFLIKEILVFHMQILVDGTDFFFYLVSHGNMLW